jgi:hypothetical protein
MLTESQAIAANTILNQISKQTLFILGAKNIIFSSDGCGGVSFKTMKVSSEYANHIKIVLDDNDTYTMTFSHIYGIRMKRIDEVKGVYCEMLHDMIEEHTGLTTTMPKVIWK